MPKRKNINSSEYGGFILTFEIARTDSILNALFDFGNAAESFSAEDWSFEKCEMIFLVKRKPKIAIFGAALMRKMGGSGGTRRIKMRISEPVLFNEVISPTEARNYSKFGDFISTAENLKRINPVTWELFIQTVKTLRPTQAEDIERLCKRRVEDRRILDSDPRTIIISKQRDAIGLTLDIAEIDRRPILSNAKIEKLPTAKSILDILDAQPVAERSIIEHDSKIFNLKLPIENEKSARFFKPYGNEIRIYVVDSTPLETATGVDLLIYNDIYKSFILMQYKAMEYDLIVKGWSYKVDGSNLDQQINTTRRLHLILSQSIEIPDILDQRLNDDAFYFKFCERTRLSAREDSLAAGIIMNANHLQKFLNLPEAKSEGHGRRIGYKNVSRYFNNSEFIFLARGGWIGSKANSTAIIAEIVAAREFGRSSIFAVIEKYSTKHC